MKTISITPTEWADLMYNLSTAFLICNEQQCVSHVTLSLNKNSPVSLQLALNFLTAKLSEKQTALPGTSITLFLSADRKFFSLFSYSKSPAPISWQITLVHNPQSFTIFCLINLR